QLPDGGLPRRVAAAQGRLALHAPGPGNPLDLVLVLAVLGLAVDLARLGAFHGEEHVPGAGTFRGAGIDIRRSHFTTPASKRLRFLLGLEVVLEVDAGVERTVRLLRLVLHVDLRKGEADVLVRAVGAVAAVRHARHDDVVHLDDEELLLPLARLAVRDGGVLQVDAGRARLHEDRRGL